MRNPYKVDPPFSVSFSGGQTSAFMLLKILEAYDFCMPKDSVVLFANTGLEHEKTYKFIHDFEMNYKIEIHWLEYSGSKTVKRVDYDKADRKGLPFDLIIRERGYIPSPRNRFCTSELKQRTMSRYVINQLGWEDGYTEVVGLRYDEPRRALNIKAEGKRDVYCPMYHAGHCLQDVDSFWDSHSFKLEIPRNLGNCVGCFLKSAKKIEMIAREEPELLGWWAKTEMWAESQEAIRTPRFRIDRPSYSGLLKMASEQKQFCFAEDDSLPCHCTE